MSFFIHALNINCQVREVVGNDRFMGKEEEGESNTQAK